MKHPSFLAIALSAALLAPAAPALAEGAEQQPAPSPEAKLAGVYAEQVGADQAGIASQARIDALDDETQKLLAEYRKAVADTASHNAYADQLERQVQSQVEELADIERQLGEVETTSRSVLPLEQKMLATLGDFVRLDVPFLVEERTARVQNLQNTMDRADVSLSEKFRRILEAYQVEMDYARTIESYEAKMAGNGERTVRFLRVGRVTLLYQTLDGTETGYWDATRKQWVRDDSYAHSFRQAVAVARKQVAPEMLLVPVPAPSTVAEEAKS